MNLAREIAVWIEKEGSFAAGLNLLERAGGSNNIHHLRNAAQRTMLTAKDYNTLLEDLQKAMRNMGYEKPEEIQREQKKTDDPDVIIGLRKLGRNLQEKARRNHEQMKAFARQTNNYEHKQQLYELAREMIEEIQPSIRRTYKKLKDYDEKGIVPIHNEETIIRQTVDKFRKHESVRTHISNLKRQMRNADTETEKAILKNKIQEKEEELKQIKIELYLWDGKEQE